MQVSIICYVDVGNNQYIAVPTKRALTTPVPWDGDLLGSQKQLPPLKQWCNWEAVPVQVHSMLVQLATFTDVRAALVVGGLALKSQEAELRAAPDVVVATPGRIIDHVMNTMAFELDSLSALVLDEADRLLELGFQEEVLL
jgi:hypothetical protein